MHMVLFIFHRKYSNKAIIIFGKKSAIFVLISVIKTQPTRNTIIQKYFSILQITE